MNEVPMVTLNRETVKDFTDLLEDAVQYITEAAYKEGELVSGETLYKVMECFAAAKQAEMSGYTYSQDDWITL